MEKILKRFGWLLGLSNLLLSERFILGCQDPKLTTTRLIPSSMSRLGRKVLMSGVTGAQESFCGSNCTFNVSFEGPYLSCVPWNFANVIEYDQIVSVYSNTWDDPFSGRPGPYFFRSNIKNTSWIGDSPS